jgi:hypothetical protein
MGTIGTGVVSWTGNFALLNSAAFSAMVTAESIRKWWQSSHERRIRSFERDRARSRKSRHPLYDHRIDRGKLLHGSPPDTGYRYRRELSQRDLDRFIPLFEKDYYLEPQTVRKAVESKGMFNLIHDEFIIKIDFVVRKDTA